MNRIKDYFHFQKEEKVAFFFLVAIIIMVIVYINFSKHRSVEKVQDFSEFQQKIEAFEASLADTSLIEPSLEKKSLINTIKKSPKKEYSLFTFDPNELSIEGWMDLGLSREQAKVIENYRKKGGHFYSKLDVKKMYSISDGKFKELEPYIQIEEKKKKEKSPITGSWERNYIEEDELLYLDLNTVDSTTLIRLSGIGPVSASRILQHRKKLGGFRNKEQLLEVWGMDSIRFKKIEESLYVDDGFRPKKININTATAKEMQRHPYFSWNVANSIEKYRDQNGEYKQLEEIKNSHLINDSLYKILVPYIRLE